MKIHKTNLIHVRFAFDKLTHISAFLASVLIVGSSANGAIGISIVHGNSHAELDGSISAADLINNGSSTLESISSTLEIVADSGGTGLNDGTSTAAAIRDESVEYLGSPSEYPATIDFNLDVSVNTLGYRLTSLATYTGVWAEHDPEWYERSHENAHQSYTVSYSLVGDPAFTEFVSVNAVADSDEHSTKVTLIGLSGAVPSGVDAVRFIWRDPIPLLASSTDPTRTVTTIREIDVFGTAVLVPEPSSAALLSSALVSLLFRRRNLQRR